MGFGDREPTSPLGQRDKMRPMSGPARELVEAWIQAGDDLDVEVVAPYRVGEQLFATWVAGFGRVAGTVVDWIASGNATAGLSADGYYVSSLNPAAYALYDRHLFRATLDDWGWHGDPERRPDWCSGHAWSAPPE